jgi:hypothetical protein
VEQVLGGIDCHRNWYGFPGIDKTTFAKRAPFCAKIKREIRPIPDFFKIGII